MNTISELPTLKNIDGVLYIPVIKQSKLDSNTFLNYKVTSDAIIQQGQTVLNLLIKAYLDLNLVGLVDLSNYYTKDEVEALIREATED